MDWTDLQITVPAKDIDTAAAIAQMVVPYGIYIEDYSDLTEEAPRIAHIDLIDEELLAKDRSNAIIHIYISPEQSPAEAIAYLTARLDQEPIPYTVDTSAVKEEEWSTAWKDYYHPTPIGRRLVVCPTWEEYTPGEGELVECQGSCEGRIAFAEEGDNGFGYDPLFLVEGGSFASIPGAEKDRISHRGNALRTLRELLLARQK